MTDAESRRNPLLSTAADSARLGEPKLAVSNARLIPGSKRARLCHDSSMQTESSADNELDSMFGDGDSAAGRQESTPTSKGGSLIGGNGLDDADGDLRGMLVRRAAELSTLVILATREMTETFSKARFKQKGAPPPTRLSAMSKVRLLKCCDGSMSFSSSREPTNHTS